MSKRYSFLLAALACAAALTWGCNKPEPDPGNDDPVDPVDLADLELSVPVTENWVFTDKPHLTIHVENPNDVKVKAEAFVRISTDRKQVVTTVELAREVPAKGSVDIDVTTQDKLEPGFYKAACFVNDRMARQFVFGVDPAAIVSAPDKQADFDRFWDDAKAQLARYELKAELTEIPKKSSDKCKVYLVEFPSVPDGLQGDSVIVRGYYLEPQDGKPHPVIMHFYGYDTMDTYVSCPGANSGEYAEFYLSHRGQYINRAPADKRGDGIQRDFTNIYGDWFAYHFGNRDGYYYRGAFMDCVQAVRFMATRPTSDMNNLFAEGSSQGGALTYAVAALSDYTFSAIAPCVAFLGDYPDYFQIVSWPGDTAKKNKGTMTDAEMYAFLSYFDTKNLATRITCPVIASVNLQDGTCPPHTNIAPFNNLASQEKEVYFYPELQHVIPGNWPSKTNAFFKAHMK